MHPASGTEQESTWVCTWTRPARSPEMFILIYLQSNLMPILSVLYSNNLTCQNIDIRALIGRIPHMKACSHSPLKPEADGRLLGRLQAETDNLNGCFLCQL